MQPNFSISAEKTALPIDDPRRRYASSATRRRNIHHGTVYQRLISRNRNDNSAESCRANADRSSLANLNHRYLAMLLSRRSANPSPLASFNPYKNVSLFDAVRHDISIRIKRDRAFTAPSASISVSRSRCSLLSRAINRRDINRIGANVIRRLAVPGDELISRRRPRHVF